MKDLEESLGFNINLFANKINHLFLDLVKKYDLAPEQRATLEIIANDKEINLSKIAKILQKDKTTVCRSLNALEKKGLIKKESTNDKRKNIISLTNKAFESLNKSETDVQEFRNKINNFLEKEEKEELFRLLRKLNEKIKEEF